MKGVLGWVKGHIVIFVMVVLMLVMLPTAYIISMRMNAGITKRQSQAYNDEKQKISRAAKVTYTLPRISSTESEASLSESRAPNDHVTNWYVEQRRLREAQIAEVAGAAIAFNRDDHQPLVANFPPPPRANDRDNRFAARAVAEAITGGRAGNQSAYALLFERMGAGEPPSREEVARSIDEYQDRELDAMTSQSATGNVTTAQRDQLAQRLVDRRLAEYRRGAEVVSFYGSPSVLYDLAEGVGSPRSMGSRGSRASAVSTIPSVMPDNPPSLTEAYMWQWDFWVVEDLLRAVVRANADATGDPLPASAAVVKRVESIRLDPYPMPKAADASSGESADPFSMGGGGMKGFPGAMGTGSESGAPQVTLTGRKSGDGPYDLRHATMTVVVSSARLPKFLSVIKATNLMTVTDLDVEEVDVWQDLARGYFYGEEHVVRATIRIESVWLREWTKQYMPQEVRTALGIPDDPRPAGGGSNTGGNANDEG
ncbi:MAG: hypothetical protein KJZ65_12430 [Phycisphaerales bacterium]|nr:hypothetical protein [Phycisphaerales bacterium]